jgi:tetratricopeptide (TPR) repeat protein
MVAADSKARLRDEAERFMIQGKIPQAIDQFLKIVEDDPEDVMTLNTVGDLYLTIGYTERAHNCFIKVAENYISNNFFLKAIAVYKKILRADPYNVQINRTIASLYAKQGLNIEACNQYFNLIKIYEQTGSTGEIIDIYQKIVELDPENVAVQQKLADIFLADGENEKAREHIISAARGLVKTAEYAGAMNCYEKALQIDPLDINGLEGFMECCLKTNNIQNILNQLDESLKSDPHNLNIKAMLGQVHLAGNNPEAASEILQTVVDSDESRYECFIPVAQAFIDLEKFDKASECLDPIIPTLITRRRTDLAMKHYKRVLEHNAEHMPTLKRLASVLSAAGDMPNYLEILDKS